MGEKIKKKLSWKKLLLVLLLFGISSFLSYYGSRDGGVGMEIGWPIKYYVRRAGIAPSCHPQPCDFMLPPFVYPIHRVILYAMADILIYYVISSIVIGFFPYVLVALAVVVVFGILLILFITKRGKKIQELYHVNGYQTMDFSNLVRNPNMFNGRHICIIATFTSGREESSLEHTIWVDGYDSDFENGKKVLVCGVFRTNSDFGHLGGYKHQIEINPDVSRLIDRLIK